MNFYVGNSIDEIDEGDVNVEFSDELINFIYKMREQVSFDMSKLYQIDPYDDVEVSENDLSQIVEICNCILDTSFSPDEWQFDHIIPKDKGGTNSYSNCQIVSRKFNRMKWNN